MEISKLRTAKPQDWEITPLPSRYTTINLNLSYSKSEKDKIVKGLIPKVMEEKWFVFFNQDTLNFHRSWTGYCIYEIYCIEDGDRFILTHANVNRNLEQYKITSDEHDRHMIPYLIDSLLLGKHSKCPSNVELKTIDNENSAEKQNKKRFTDFIRIIHTHRFLGFPAPAHRPYAFYADVKSLKGRTIAECYSIVKGLNLPSEIVEHISSPYLWDQVGYKNGDYEAPATEITVKKKKNIIIENFPINVLEKEKFVVLRVPRHVAICDLDVFPATWTALSYIISDPERMGARQPGWDMELNEYASARIHALFNKVHAKSDKGMLALTRSKEDLRLTDLDRLPDPSEEKESYHYLSWDSCFTNKIIELFGIHGRCWHGCGYIGMVGEPICRFFLLRNKMIPNIKISVMSGSDILKI